MEVSFEERCPEEEVPLYEKGVPFVNKRYTKGVPSLLKMVYKRVRGWTSPDVEPLRRKRFWVKCKGPWKGEKWEGSNVLPVLQRLAHLWGLGTRHSYDRDGNKNVPKSDWFSKQNNNCSRAPRARFFLPLVVSAIKGLLWINPLLTKLVRSSSDIGPVVVVVSLFVCFLLATTLSRSH